MTIYAIVNNLINRPVPDASDRPIWTVLSASSILQGGNPYFVPDFDSKFEAHAALAVRIGKLGKSIAPRFAHRYVESVAPASIMIAADLLQTVIKTGYPWAMAMSYDRSLAIGNHTRMEFSQIPGITASIELSEDSDKFHSVFDMSCSPFGIEDIISQISRDNALKTGDIILIGIDKAGIPLRPGQKANLMLDAEESLRFNIR